MVARLALFLALSVPFAACQSSESAVDRGDRLWADSAYPEALAEYRLAASQREDDEEALVRLAHAYTELGQLAEARDTYERLLARSPAYVDQAVYDYLQLVDRAMRRGDDYGVALALGAALALRPELQLPDAMRPVAAFHRESGQLDDALEYYRRALSTLPPDSTPEIVYAIGLLNEELDRCETAMDYYRAFEVQARRQGPRPWRTLLGEARWHTGNCAFTLARRAQRQDRTARALEYYDQMIGLGEPENLLDRAWFERGEILYAAGRFDDALAAYRMVLERNPSRTGQLVERAQRRIDEIRFGPASAGGRGADTTRGGPGSPGT